MKKKKNVLQEKSNENETFIFLEKQPVDFS